MLKTLINIIIICGAMFVGYILGYNHITEFRFKIDPVVIEKVTEASRSILVQDN
jgi:hypothetical protein